MGSRMKKTLDKWCENDLQTIKDKITQLESGSGSGSTVGSDVSTAVGKGPRGTFTRPLPGLAIRLNDLFYGRRPASFAEEEKSHPDLS